MSDVVGATGVYASGIVAAADSLVGGLRLPADKSVAHRALLFNAMAEGEAEVTVARPGEDVLSMAHVLQRLGAVESIGEGPAEFTRVRLRGGGTRAAALLPGAGGETLDCGNAGTAMRLLIGALAGRPGVATLVGDASLTARPMERVAAPLRSVGADIVTEEGHAPVMVRGSRKLRAIEHRLSVASAQVIGALALAGLAAQGTTVITSPGPTRDHTERMLAWLGAPVRREGYVTTVEGPAGFRARTIDVPGDISGAAAWLVAGALHPDAHIVIEEVGLNPSRTGIIDVLREMGADIKVASDGPTEWCPEPVGTIIVSGGRPLRAIDLSGDRVADVIDELPLIAMAMAAAEGTSTLSGARELRVKESDRISRVVEGLQAVGAHAEEREDGWIISRGTPRDAAIRTDGDHRIAMSFAVAALTGVAGTVEIDDPASAAVSYPTFWTDLEHLAT
ncbi:MAG: 3-phosphoshikimate 1-carboxyvinyltransferase [Candidatus Limnocylindrales bacterium]